MLNKVGYRPSEDILNKHIIDNSCGNGAFLCEIVDRYIKAGILNGFSKERLINGLETFIHGVEIDNNLCRETIKRLNSTASRYSITNVKWDIVNADVVDCMNVYNYKMDFVVGNPPYCKVHDLTIEQRVKYKNICGKSKGTFDSYVMFFWIGIRMLRRNGKLIYITPSSWTTSLYARELREWMCNNNGIVSIIDMKHQKIFNDATTFTMITELGNFHHNENTVVYEYSNKGVITKINDAPTKDYMDCTNGIFYFKDNETLSTIKGINGISSDNTTQMFDVKNGFATLSDKLFIYDLKDISISYDNIIFCTKASKDILKCIIYPYDKNGNPLKFKELNGYVQYLLMYRAKELEVDTNKDGWHLYGRNQAVKDVFKPKFAINNLVNSIDDIKLRYLCDGIGVYSGFYILSNDSFTQQSTIDFVNNTLKSQKFVNYIHSLGRYKNGGFSTFTTRELRNYLNYEWRKQQIL